METNNNTNIACLHNTVLETMNQSSIVQRAQSSIAVLSQTWTFVLFARCCISDCWHIHRFPTVLFNWSVVWWGSQSWTIRTNNRFTCYFHDSNWLNMGTNKIFKKKCISVVPCTVLTYACRVHNLDWNGLSILQQDLCDATFSSGISHRGHTHQLAHAEQGQGVTERYAFTTTAAWLEELGGTQQNRLWRCRAGQLLGFWWWWWCCRLGSVFNWTQGRL